MFNRSYFAGRYFTARYWAESQGQAAIFVTLPDGMVGSLHSTLNTRSAQPYLATRTVHAHLNTRSIEEA